MRRPRGGEWAKTARRTPGATVEAAAQPSEAGPPRQRALDPGLYLVATPIGNAGDITLRALEVLHGVDVIACEDTRVSAKLCAIHGIRTARLAYHDHNADRVRPRLLERLAAGERVALISDAGTPLVSDPGYKLVRDAIDRGIRVETLPGPSALLAALLLSGLPSDRFLFEGFLDAKAGGRRKALERVAAVPATLIFYESGPRLAASLADMAEILGDRPAAVARELTKRFEEVVRAPLAELARRYAAAEPPRGEIVVVVGPPLDPVAPSEAELDRELRRALESSSLRDAASEVATALGLPRRAVYARALALAGDER